MFCNFMNTVLLFLAILNNSLCSDFKNMKSAGAIRNSIDDLLNVIGTLKSVKTDDILALSNVFDKHGLRTWEYNKRDLEKMMEQLKLAIPLFVDTNQDRKVLYFDDDPNRTVKQALRKKSDSDDDNESDNKIKSDESNSHEKLNIPNNNVRKDTVRNYDCEYWKDECIEACKEAYREACYIEDCRKRLRRRLRRYCKRYCTTWFY